MEKTHLEVNINGKNQDCIISHLMVAKKNDEGKIIWTNPEDCIAKVQGYVNEIIVYVKDNNDVVNEIKLSTFAIKSLYYHIMEIEAKEGEEFHNVAL